jgi:hypothetical protein
MFDYNRCCMSDYNRVCMVDYNPRCTAHYKLDYVWLVMSNNKPIVLRIVVQYYIYISAMCIEGCTGGV